MCGATGICSSPIWVFCSCTHGGKLLFANHKSDRKISAFFSTVIQEVVEPLIMFKNTNNWSTVTNGSGVLGCSTGRG